MSYKVIIFYGGFGIVSDALKVLNCVQIGSKKYRFFDYRVECDSDISQNADIYIFCSITILVITLIIPIYLLT